jgi:hypothetical protein
MITRMAILMGGRPGGSVPLDREPRRNRNEEGRSRLWPYLWGGGAILGLTGLLGGVMALGMRSDNQGRKMHERDDPRLLSELQRDGFDLGSVLYDDGKQHARLELKVAGAAGAFCLVDADATMTRDGQGDITDLHDYTFTGYANPNVSTQYSGGMWRRRVTGAKYTLTVQDLNGLETAAGGPEHDFCASQGAVAAMLNGNR